MIVKTMRYKITDAFDPSASIFVSANAGAGKTSLLTNRVLRLLLSDSPPGKILCLTFTKAAAAEMSNRVLTILGRWVMLDDNALVSALETISGQAPDTHTLKKARSLFASVLESPEGVRIETIHGFCQSLLKRFPLESGVSPQFTVMDSRTEQELLKEAGLRLYGMAQTQDKKLSDSLRAIARMLPESRFQALLQEIIDHKRSIRGLFSLSGDVETAIEKLWQSLRMKRHASMESLFDEYLSVHDAHRPNWRAIIELLLVGDEAEQAMAQGLLLWLEAGERRQHIGHYTNLFLTQKGTPRVTLFKKNTIKDQALIDHFRQEQQRVLHFSQLSKALEIAKRTTHMLYLAEAFLTIYTQLKETRALMDYDDLILKSCALLAKPGIAPWVLYKLDGGIDHILVDEAQDTSPEQWTIIDALTQEFFAGQGRETKDRSLFVVGDEKQSIFSFQGADPAALDRMREHFSDRIKAAGIALHHIPLTHSYRSAPEILQAVDAIFAQSNAKAGLTFDDTRLEHTAKRAEAAGLVELWPLSQPAAENNEFALSETTQLARDVASAISGWLEKGVMLDSKNRAIEPGDIMILVRTRTRFVDKLIRALKRKNIPVAGHDRMMLNNNLAVQDLIALTQCLLLPEDNLTLACLLKSPLFNFSEEQLFTLCWQRNGQSVWQRLQNDPACHEAYALLADLRSRADYISPFELYSYVLDTLGARKKIIGRMGEEYNDPIDEFLGQALLYERSHPPSLQGFLHWLNASDSEIKRDMEQSKSSVRIMTVHGAKGLQAPIVIMPDTTTVPVLKSALLWDDSGTLPFWPGSRDCDDPICAAFRERDKQDMLAENRRLLYVALTRAEDRLYICGASGREKINDQSWYAMIKSGLEPIAQRFDINGKEALRLGNVPSSSAKPVQSAQASQCASLSFLQTPVSPEPTPPQPLVPSRLAGEEPPASSPKQSQDVYQRGTLIHQLLQYLPDIASHERKSAATRIAGFYAKFLPDTIRAECVGQSLAVLDDMRFQFLFAAGSLAEVPVAGCVNVNGKAVAVAGQIDRLAISENEVWIADFKSNRLPPSNTQIPIAYLRQMALYRALLKQIYPDKSVKCLLLWTSAPSVTVLDNALLDELPVSTYI